MERQPFPPARRLRFWKELTLFTLIAIPVFLFVAWISLPPLPNLPSTLSSITRSGLLKVRLRTNSGEWINSPVVNRFAVSEVLNLSTLSPFFLKALLTSEDKEFFYHRGVDFRALISASWINFKHRSLIRGGSTITEQVARMILGGPQGLQRRFQSMRLAWELEEQYSKEEILSFYLSQLTFPGNVRGIEEGAKALFDRDFNSLTKKELLALICTIRAPSVLNPFRGGAKKIEVRVNQLVQALVDQGALSKTESTDIQNQTLIFAKENRTLNAPHFARAVFESLRPHHSENSIKERVITTLNSDLQKTTKSIIGRMVTMLAPRRGTDAGALIVEKKSGAIRAWVSVHDGGESEIDAVLTKRQPGSTLKPFLYGAALDQGWTPATILHDDPTSRAVGSGLKAFKNYSRKFYGAVSLREGLGNSLNIPAIETITFLGVPKFLEILKSFGFTSLTEPPMFYGEGLALGNGEVSLFELVQGYVAIANLGNFSPLILTEIEEAGTKKSKRVLSPASAALIADILSDPSAQAREFGDVIEPPYRYAYKTGTSTDYKDAWIVGFSEEFVVGIWLGNFQRESLKAVTGAEGPAHALRSIFVELGRRFGRAPIKDSPLLNKVSVCTFSGALPSAQCPNTVTTFSKQNPPKARCDGNHTGTPLTLETPHIQYPTPGLIMAYDPRIPSTLQMFTFKIAGVPSKARVEWILNDIKIGEGSSLPWKVARGTFLLKARINTSTTTTETESVRFYVK